MIRKMNALDLFRSLYADEQKAKNSYILTDLPTDGFVWIDMRDILQKNPGGFNIKSSGVWVQEDRVSHLRRVLQLSLYADIENCTIIFFRIPDIRSRIIISIKGAGHTGAFFSQRRMNFSARMVHQNCSLTVGENTYIGGASLTMLETEISVSAGGLWSDGILLQGSDSHGIVDLDTMSIVNGGPRKITLGRRVWLGRRSSVMKDVEIGAGSIVASGAVVTKDVPAACAVAGVPARVVRERVSWSQSLSQISSGENLFFRKLHRSLD